MNDERITNKGSVIAIFGVPEGLSAGEYIINFQPERFAKIKTDKGYADFLNFDRQDSGAWELGWIYKKSM